MRHARRSLRLGAQRSPSPLLPSRFTHHHSLPTHTHTHTHSHLPSTRLPPAVGPQHAAPAGAPVMLSRFCFLPAKQQSLNVPRCLPLCALWPQLGPSRPHPLRPTWPDLREGALRAGLPQLPLTLLNSVIAVSQLADSLFPDRCEAVDHVPGPVPGQVCSGTMCRDDKACSKTSQGEQGEGITAVLQLGRALVLAVRYATLGIQACSGVAVRYATLGIHKPDRRVLQLCSSQLRSDVAACWHLTAGRQALPPGTSKPGPSFIAPPPAGATPPAGGPPPWRCPWGSSTWGAAGWAPCPAATGRGAWRRMWVRM